MATWSRAGERCTIEKERGLLAAVVALSFPLDLDLCFACCVVLCRFVNVLECASRDVAGGVGVLSLRMHLLLYVLINSSTRFLCFPYACACSYNSLVYVRSGQKVTGIPLRAHLNRGGDI